MVKRQFGAEYMILALVIIVALIGFAWVMQPASVGRSWESVFECQDECFPKKTTLHDGKESCENCLKQQRITGGFTVAEPKQFGGDIQGIVDESSRAFVGRAATTDGAGCYTCDCMTSGITAYDGQTAQRVCSQNCNGLITGIKQGVC